MQQRGVFDSTPGLRCEVYCFHASAFKDESLGDVKTLDTVLLMYGTMCERP